MAEHRLAPGQGSHPLQKRPPINKMAHNYVYHEATAVERADKPLFIWTHTTKEHTPRYEMDNPRLEGDVENGVVNRYVTEQMQAIAGAGELQPKDDNERRRFFAWIRGQRTDETWKSLRTEVQQALNDVSNQLAAFAAQQQRDFGADLGSLTRRGGIDLGAETEEQFAELLKENTSMRRDIRTQLEEVNRRKLEFAREDADAAIGIYTHAQWDDLPEASQRMLDRAFENWKWNWLVSGVTRDVGHLVRSMLREGAPAYVRAGKSRDVEKALRLIYGFHDQLVAANDDTRKAELSALIAAQEKKLYGYLSSLTRQWIKSGEYEFEPGPTGLAQAQGDAWVEALSLDENRDPTTGEIRPNVLMVDATYDEPSWETAGIVCDTVLEYAVARNALKRLTEVRTIPGPFLTSQPTIESIGRNDYIVNFAPIDGLKDSLTGSNLLPPLTQFNNDLKEVKSYLDELTDSRTKIMEELAKNRRKSVGAEAASQQEKIEKKTFKKYLKTLPPRPGGGGGGQRSHPIVEMARRAISTSVNRALAEHDTNELNAVLADLNTEIAETGNRIIDLEARIGQFNTAIAANLIPAEQSEYQSRLQRAQEKHYDTLLRKLENFLGSHEYAGTIDKHLSPQEIETVAALAGIEVSYKMNDDGSRGRARGFFPQVEWTGDVERKRRLPNGEYEIIRDTSGSPEMFRGDFAAINIWRIQEQSGRASVDIVRQMAEDPDRYKKFQELRRPVTRPDGRQSAKPKALLVYGFAASPDSGGGLGRSRTGLRTEVVREVMEHEKMDPRELHERFLDDLHLQRKLGVRPEEVELAQTIDTARDYLLRHDFFPAELGWGYWRFAVTSEDPHNLGTQLGDMQAAGKPLENTTLRERPFNDELDVTNEHSYTIVRDSESPSLPIDHLYRNENLTGPQNPEAPKNLVERVCRSMFGKLDLVEHHSKLGGQPITARPLHWSEEAIRSLGATLYALLNASEELRHQIETIQLNRAALNPIEQLRLLIEIHDHYLVFLTYDIMDSEGNIIPNNANPRFETWFNSRITNHGKKNSALRDRRLTYANTEADEAFAPGTTVSYVEQAGDQLDLAQDDYVWDIWMKDLLGMQALGLLPHITTYEEALQLSRNPEALQKFSRDIAEESARRAFEPALTEEIRTFEQMAMARKVTVAQRIKGAVDMSKPLEIAREASALVGGIPGGNLLLRRYKPRFIKALKRYKQVGQLEWIAAGRIAQAIQTTNQRGWEGVVNPEKSDLIVEDDEQYGLQFDETTDLVIQMILDTVIQETADATDRDIAAAFGNLAARPLKNLGVDIRFLRDKIRRATTNIPDFQYVDIHGQLRQAPDPANPPLPGNIDPDSLGDERRTPVVEVPRVLRLYVQKSLRNKRWNAIHGKAIARDRTRNNPPMIADRWTNP